MRFGGLQGSLVFAALLSLGVAGLIILYARKQNQSAAVAAPATKPDKRNKTAKIKEAYPSRIRSVILAGFAISGFTSLAYEVLFTRVLTLFFRDSVYDFAIVL